MCFFIYLQNKKRDESVTRSFITPCMKTAGFIVQFALPPQGCVPLSVSQVPSISLQTH